MKKGFVIVLIFLTLLFFRPSFIIATSGCCSSHGGVKCSAGAQANGNVICNDGWTGSSCAYSSMVMCQGTATSSNTPIPPTIYVPSTTSIPVIPTSTPVPPTLTPTPKPTNTPTVAPTGTKVQVLGADVTITPTPSSTSSSNSFLGFILIAVLGYFGYRYMKKKSDNKTLPTSSDNKQQIN